ncbi:MAG: hypothetical protein E7470_01215 [Ruminococcaceae bacterium]|nr:hypothetical protein [Oscillospiraceae bacterium]
MSRALLVGTAPPLQLGYEYTQTPPYDAVVIGSMRLSELLQFQNEAVLQALSEGLPVFLYTPGLPASPKNRALSASLAAAQRELKNWGVVFTDGGQKRLITAKQARELRAAGQKPAPGAVLTPLAKEILEGQT